MSFDKPTRNALARMVGAARQILKDDITKQLQSDFRLQPDGAALALDGLTEDQRVAAIELRELLEHYAASEPGTEQTRRKEAFSRLAREIGFTILNRLAALRLCEERGLVIECVRKGMASDGVRMFEMLAHGALGTRYQTYRVFIENLFDELALDLGALFDRHLPLSRVFPSERALEQVLALLNDPALAHLWREDETIGWIYQYYNDESERKQMRDESQAPRNSRELAVRNQFFTPRYVVEFLTDNTLGRIWYEMRGGDTRLAKDCRYLVRVPAGSEQYSVNSVQSSVDSEQSDAIRPSPLAIRPKKDPREILMLDPAGGSGHFGLYCFDLFETIYAEAYDDPDLAPKLRADFPDRDEFLRQIPRLILEHNIHIIDIDPRACQIAALALWLRAQRGWQKMNLKPEARPRIRKVNVVCAEPMPGEKDLLEEFVAQLEPKELGQLVRFVFERMKLAGEAGSLLKIEEDLRDKIERLRKKAGPLFAQGDFWDNAEARVLEALQAYAEQAANGNTTRRRLFADDAAQGFAFIDLCRKKYDVVLMNPPFGLSPEELYMYLAKDYPDTFIDLLGAFIERAHILSQTGYIGAITSRACLYTKTLLDWRKRFLSGKIIALADLGMGVLDAAMVRACAYVLPGGDARTTGIFIDLRKSETKTEDLSNSIVLLNDGNTSSGQTYLCPADLFDDIPQHRILYWLSPWFWSRVKTLQPFEPQIGSVRAGLTTYDNERFIRASWEISPNHIGQQSDWVFISKGGYYGTFYADIHLVVKWKDKGSEVGAFNRQRYDTDAQSRRGSKYYLRPALTYSRRTDYFSARLLPTNCFFTDKGPAILSESNASPLYLLGLFNSNLFRALVHSQSQGGCFETGVLKLLPWITPTENAKHSIELLAREIWETKSRIFSRSEVDANFVLAFDKKASLAQTHEHLLSSSEFVNTEVQTKADRISELVESEYELTLDDYEALDVFQNDHEIKETLAILAVSDFTALAVSYLIGCAFGRWDIRIALDPTLVPRLQDPFDPLPVCPPGMLVGTDGLPATPKTIVSEEWLRARPNAITLPDIAKLKANRSPLTTTHYPLAIAWDGILVDDPGLDGNAAHPADIVRRVRDALSMLWGDRAQAIEDEACEILGVGDLRDYFRKPTGFFADHLKRYSKSRRQAPIYLPLSTTSGRLTVWVYYHRLTQDTLFTIVNQYVNPKIESVDKRVDQLAEKLNGASGKNTTDLREQLNDAKEFLSELREFRTELLRVAQLPYKPNLNDGVIITVAPLHKLFRLRKWATDTAAVWKKLEAGEYDWSHMAFNIWTSRVKKKCETDRSIAIAHGLEHLCKVEAKKAGKAKKKREEEDEEE